MHFKPIEQWTVEDVAVWLLCIGLGKNVVELFKENEVNGSDLLILSTPELTDGLGLNHMEAKKALLALEFTRSINDLETLAAELKAVQLEKRGLQDQLAAKDEMISELLDQQLKTPDRAEARQQHQHLEDEVLSLEHRHEAERRRLEERHEREMVMEEASIRERRTAADSSSPSERAEEPGKRHYEEVPYDPHRLF